VGDAEDDRRALHLEDFEDLLDRLGTADGLDRNVRHLTAGNLRHGLDDVVAVRVQGVRGAELLGNVEAVVQLVDDDDVATAAAYQEVRERKANGTLADDDGTLAQQVPDLSDCVEHGADRLAEHPLAAVVVHRYGDGAEAGDGAVLAQAARLQGNDA